MEDRIRRAPTLIVVNESGQEVGSGKGNSHSLWVLSRRLVRMLLKQEGPIALTAAAAVLVGPGGVSDPSKHRSQTQVGPARPPSRTAGQRAAADDCLLLLLLLPLLLLPLRPPLRVVLCAVAAASAHPSALRCSRRCPRRCPRRLLLQITVERRLYDIGSILCSVGLLERIYMKKRYAAVAPLLPVVPLAGLLLLLPYRGTIVAAAAAAAPTVVPLSRHIGAPPQLTHSPLLSVLNLLLPLPLLLLLQAARV